MDNGCELCRFQSSVYILLYLNNVAKENAWLVCLRKRRNFLSYKLY